MKESKKKGGKPSEASRGSRSQSAGRKITSNLYQPSGRLGANQKKEQIGKSNVINM